MARKRISLLPFEARVDNMIVSRHYTIEAARKALDAAERAKWARGAKTLRIHDTDTGREIE